MTATRGPTLSNAAPLFAFFYFLLPHVSSAEVFNAYRHNNLAGNVIAGQYHESPYASCAAGVGFFWDGTNKIIGVNFSPTTQVCKWRTETAGQVTPTERYGAPVCPDDETFSFEHQSCGDWIDPRQAYSLGFAAYLWFSLTSGLLVGYRFGS